MVGWFVDRIGAIRVVWVLTIKNGRLQIMQIDNFELLLSYVAAMIDQGVGLTSDGRPKVDALEEYAKGQGVDVDIDASTRDAVYDAYKERYDSGEEGDGNDGNDGGDEPAEESPVEADGPQVSSTPPSSVPEAPNATGRPPAAPIAPKARTERKVRTDIEDAPDEPVLQGEWTFQDGWWCSLKHGVAVSPESLLAHNKIPEINALNRKHWEGEKRDRFLTGIYQEQRHGLINIFHPYG